MKTPKEFNNFGEGFHQDIIDLTSGMSEMINEGIDYLNAQELVVVKSYIEHLLSGPYTPGQLDDIWMKTGTDIYIHDKKNRLFFEQILVEMEKRL
ncbi:MAG: hypothetical protein JKY83_11995 [Rhizobiaceae bacterium]|nr:hypothetical protein [Rhizobiaceae bacterium]